MVGYTTSKWTLEEIRRKRTQAHEEWAKLTKEEQEKWHAASVYMGSRRGGEYVYVQARTCDMSRVWKPWLAMFGIQSVEEIQ